MEHRLENERQFIELVQQLTQTQQQQVLQRLKDLSEPTQVSEYKRSPLLDPRQIIP
jgi:hypothetical protein